MVESVGGIGNFNAMAAMKQIEVISSEVLHDYATAFLQTMLKCSVASWSCHVEMCWQRLLMVKRRGAAYSAYDGDFMFR
jgi:hypothetical protein